MWQIHRRYPCRWGGVVDGKPIISNLDSFGNRVMNNIWTAIKNNYLKQVCKSLLCILYSIDYLRLQCCFSMNFFGQVFIPRLFYVDWELWRHRGYVTRSICWKSSWKFCWSKVGFKAMFRNYINIRKNKMQYFDCIREDRMRKNFILGWYFAQCILLTSGLFWAKLRLC